MHALGIGVAVFLTAYICRKSLYERDVVRSGRMEGEIFVDEKKVTVDDRWS